MKIEICDEDIAHIKHCLERTSSMCEPLEDLWPFTLRDIVKEYEEKKNGN